MGFTQPSDVPDGYQVQMTDEMIGEQGRRFFKWRARRFQDKYRPGVNSYHLRIEPLGWFRYAIVAYQNRLFKIEDSGEYKPHGSGLQGENPV